MNGRREKGREGRRKGGKKGEMKGWMEGGREGWKEGMEGGRDGRTEGWLVDQFGQFLLIIHFLFQNTEVCVLYFCTG